MIILTGAKETDKIQDPFIKKTSKLGMGGNTLIQMEGIYQKIYKKLIMIDSQLFPLRLRARMSPLSWRSSKYNKARKTKDTHLGN